VGYWLFKFVFLGPFLRLLWRPWAEGAENIPTDRPAIIASNHLSVCDSFFMPVVIRRKVTFLGKSEYFTTPGLKGRVVRSFMSAIGVVPIDRDDKDAARASLTTGVRVLAEGKLLGIYPEGTRSPDGRLYRGKTGVARLALESGAVVIPCVMIDTATIQPPGRVVPKFRPRPGVRFGAPLDFSRYEGMSGDRFVERSMTDEIMYALMEMSGQEYVDQYAANVKRQHGSGPAFGARDRVREIGDRVPGTKAS
jgi:1-acyl-sn-glycerol-3-phosphate acyltransferase